jgi:hypothetical protein
MLTARRKIRQRVHNKIMKVIQESGCSTIRKDRRKTEYLGQSSERALPGTQTAGRLARSDG